MRHSGEAAAQTLFSDHEEPAPKSAQAAQSARDVSRKEDDAAAAAAARGKVPKLQAENLAPWCYQQMFKTADYLTLRAPDQSVMQKLPAAKEAKQRLPPRNHCRPVLKGAPFIVCSGCFKLVQVSADFAVFTKKVHKLRCGSCSAVLSYAYRVPARKKPYQKSIDQLRSIADAALLLLEVLGARRRELGRSSNSWLETGTLFGGFHEPKTWTKYLMKNVVTRQGLDTYTWSSTSTLTEEDSFDPHKYSYRQGRYYSSQLSNGPPESLSSLGYPHAIYGNQYLSSTSGTSEGSESHQSYSNLSSVTEVSSYSGNKEYNKDGGSLLSIPELGQTCLEQTTEVYRADNDNSKNKSGLNVALKKIAEQLSLGDDEDDYIYTNQVQPLGFATNIESTDKKDDNQIGLGRNIAPSWEDVLHSSSGLPTPSIYQSDVQYQQNSEYHPPGSLDSSDLRIQLSAAKRFLLGPEASIDSPSSNFILRNKKNGGTDILSAHESRLESSLNPDWKTKAPLTFQSNSQGSEITELLFDRGQLEPYSRADTRLTLGQIKQFNIREISPEWAFSYEITKVIITGDFLFDSSNLCWAVMFGDSEVPAEIVQPGVLRCHTPLHSSGKLRVCITSGNREVCSEFKEFEFRSKPTSSGSSDLAPSSRSLKSSEELLFLAKFVRMLLLENGSSEVPDSDPQSGQCPKLRMNEELWDRLIHELNLGCENPLSTVDQIMEELLKSRLQRWLSVKLKGFNGTSSSLSKHDQGIIHLISALGYEWALSSVLSAGVGLNFRDSNGWTALHWAAYFGREKMVAALLAAGASATAVTDPTAQDPVGKTAAFLASERGHTGLAGYLSEVSLTSYLASLTIEESDVSKGSAEIEAERAVESISQRSAQLHGGTEDELSMKDSLAAVRNAAQAAARIQNAFRAFSFRKRQQKTARLRDEYGMTQEDIDELAAASRLYHQAHASSGQFYDKAAVSIQKKYKGWKGRKHFLNMRRNAVKIQAHVRGHQVRKKYRTIVSTVSVLEKVILRWRRKGHGLRGFRAEQQPMVGAVEEDDEEDDDFDDDEAVKVFRRQKVDQAVKEAVSRVLSMVDSTEARMQYRRMLEEFRQASAELGGSQEVTSIFDSDLEILGINNFML